MKKIFESVRQWTKKQIPDKDIKAVLDTLANNNVYYPSDFTISLTNEQKENAQKANEELNEKTKSLFYEIEHNEWSEAQGENVATIIFGLVLSANGDTLKKEVKNRVKIKYETKGGKADVAFVKKVEYPISLQRVQDIKTYLDTKVTHPFPEVMYEDLRHTKKFTDVPWGVLTHIVSYYHAHNGDVTAKDMLGYVKRKMIKEVPLNKRGANIKSEVMIGKKIQFIKDVQKIKKETGFDVPSKEDLAKDKTVMGFSEHVAGKNATIVGEEDGDYVVRVDGDKYDLHNVPKSIFLVGYTKKAKNGANIKGVTDKPNTNIKGVNSKFLSNLDDLMIDYKTGTLREQVIEALYEVYAEDIAEMNDDGSDEFQDETLKSQVFDYLPKIKARGAIFKENGDLALAISMMVSGNKELENDALKIAKNSTAKAKNGANVPENTEVTTKQFNIYFQKHYGYIGHSLTSKQIEKFLQRSYIKEAPLPKKADLFQDYLLANGLADDVQLKDGGNTDTTSAKKRVKKRLEENLEKIKQGKYKAGAKIPQFEKLPKNRQANKKYAYFAVGKADGKIVDGWEIVYDVQSLKESAPNDLKDNDFNPKDFRILSKETIIRTMGINPFDYNNWRKFDYSNDVKPEQAKNGANVGFIKLTKNQKARLDVLQGKEDISDLNEAENKEYEALVKLYRKTKDYKGRKAKGGYVFKGDKYEFVPHKFIYEIGGL